MAKESRIQNLIVGAVFLGGLALLGVATLFVKGISVTEAKPVKVRFHDVDNLRTGEKVVIHGLAVGEVTAIRYAPDDSRDDATSSDGSIIVRCLLPPQVPLTNNTIFRIRNLGPLGGKYVEIIPQEGDPKAFEWDGFVGTADPDIFERLSELVGDVRGEGIDISQAGLLPRLIRDEQLATKAEQTLDEFKRTFEEFNNQMQSSQGLLPRLIRDEELARKAESIFDQIDIAMKTINAEEGLVADLEAAAESLKQVGADVAEGKGILGYLIGDAEARAKLESTLDRVATAVERLEKNDSLLGRLLSDEQTARDFDEIVKNLREVTDEINSGDGTLAHIINDRAAWDELMRLLTIAREAVEDLREQAPISTFANVIFAVF